MKLYLSSYQVGGQANILSELFAMSKRVGVIRNALDYSDDKERLKNGRDREFIELRSIGLKPEDIDLRNYFDRESELAERLEDLDGLWVVGGNAFILRRAMSQSGLDKILMNKLQDESFVYAGYSAGACVVGSTLNGLHLVDKPNFIPDGYKSEIIWDGLGLLPFSIAPHYRSEHPESQMIERVVEFFIHNKIPFIALRDGEACIR